MAKLNPPQIGSKLPAFYGTTLEVPFNLNRAVGFSQISGVRIQIKTVQSGTNKGVYEALKPSQVYYDSVNRNYLARFKLTESKNDVTFEPLIGQYYKVQMAFIEASTGDLGYWSDVGVVKCTAQPRMYIEGCVDGDTSYNYIYTGVYAQSLGADDPEDKKYDPTEKVYSYEFNLYDDNNNLVATSGELIHNHSTDDVTNQSSDTWTVRKNLEANLRYEIEYKATTMNGLEVSTPRYAIIDTELVPPNVHAKLSAVAYPDDGYVAISLVGDGSKTLVNGSFVLLRSGSDENYDSWYELTKFYLSSWNATTTKLICRDHTVEHGVKYKYAIQAYNSVGLYSDRMLNTEGEVNCNFEDAFLWDGERQLKIRFNPKVSSFKSTILETKTDTIGGKYPFIFRNGNVEYKEFPISGLLSMLSDENNLFLTGLYQENTGERQMTRAAAGSPVVGISRTQLSSENYYLERQFKMEALAWLTNGQPKLFRSPAEGNYIVRLMNTSLAPNDQLGRMLHTFSCTAYEIAECNFDNLRDYSFTVPSYTETRTLKINQIPLWDPIQWPDMLGDDGKTIELPHAYLASITGTPRSNFTYKLADSGDDHIGTTGLTGTFIFPDEVLRTTPLVSITPVGSWGSDTYLTYGYYDAPPDTFSHIYDITLSDKSAQVIGQGIRTDLIEYLKLVDIRKKTGAFHYIKVQPRDIKYIYEKNNRYYYNNSGLVVDDWIDNTLYFIVEFGQSVDTAVYYIDGRDKQTLTKNLIIDLSYGFRLNGSSVIDFTGANSLTTGRYEALTNISSVDEMYAGNGLLVDMIYQEKIILYTVENNNETVRGYKQAWLNNPTDETYRAYIAALTTALRAMEDDYNVEYAI